MAVQEGDIVRVVLEGEASRGGADCLLVRIGTHGNWVNPSAPHVKSVEVIKPAKPKVGDVIHSRRDLKHLPSGSVVTNNYNDTLLVGKGTTLGITTYGVYNDEPMPLKDGVNSPPYTVRYIPE